MKSDNQGEIIKFSSNYDKIIYYFNCRELGLNAEVNFFNNLIIIENSNKGNIIKSTSPYRKIPTLSDFKKIIIPKGY